MAQPARTQGQLEDFDALWRAIDSGYAYFDDSGAGWRRVRQQWRAKAGAAKSREEFINALESALAHLRDDHVGLSERTPASARRIPAEADIWATWRDGNAVVTAVRTFSDADVAGVRPGLVVTAVDGMPIEKAIRERLGNAAATPFAREWALRQLLSGPRSGTLKLRVNDGRAESALDIEHGISRPENGPPLIARRMGDNRDIGYIRIKNALGNAGFPAHFDGALNYLKDTRALILDLRETSASGSRDVVRAILGRFTAREAPWLLKEARGGPRETERVPPRGQPYLAPLIVLVDRWTAGEGESLAAGLDAVANATLVGTPMAGLRGDVREVRLARSGITVRFPAQKTFHTNATPRESLKPEVEVDLAAPRGGPGDPILYEALKLTEANAGTRPPDRR